MDIKSINVTLCQIGNLRRRIISNFLKDIINSNLNSSHLDIFEVLWREDYINVSTISNITGHAKASLTSMLEKLENEGYLNRNINPDNRREVIVNLTKKGKDLELIYYSEIKSLNEMLYFDFDENELKTCKNLLIKLKNNIDRKVI